MINTHLRRFAIAVLLVTGIGCGSDPLAPFEPEETNAVDNLQVQATGVRNVTDVRSYAWQNTGTRATINHSTTISTGAAHLVIRDAAGTVVYSKDLLPSLNEASLTGLSGVWQVELALTNYSGTLNFRVQKL